MGKIQFELNNHNDARKNFEAAIKSNSEPDIVKLASESIGLLNN
jgi:hypothetical protein